MDLAKPCIDVGLHTNQRDAMLRFWQERVGLRFDHTLKLGGGQQQHRHDMNGSVLKVNHARDPLPELAPAGYRELLIARSGRREAESLRDPDGNRVTLLPPGSEGVTGIGVRLAVRDEAAFHEFYTKALQLEPLVDRAYRCGDSLLFVSRDGSATRTDALSGPGYRYITIQVRDVDAEHRGILERGGEEARAPITLGSVARISFVCDPDGNWIEISQRASLTGPLPDS